MSHGPNAATNTETAAYRQRWSRLQTGVSDTIDKRTLLPADQGRVGPGVASQPLNGYRDGQSSAWATMTWSPSNVTAGLP